MEYARNTQLCTGTALYTLYYISTDNKVMAKTGSIVFTTDLADEYGFKDIDGK